MILDDAFAVEVEHRVGASPDVVFQYFTDPEKHRRWMGAEAELDPRPGGIYRLHMAPGVNVTGEYLEIEPPRRLLLTWGWSGSVDLPNCLARIGPGASAVEFLFTEDGDETIIRVRHLGLLTEDARWAHGLGWNGYLPRLTSLFSNGDPGKDPTLDLAAAYYASEAPAP